jgi:hypothetical protein
MVLVDRCNISNGAAVSDIGVVLVPSEVVAGISNVRVWKSIPLAMVLSDMEVMGYALSKDVLRSELSEFVWETVAMVEPQLLGPGGWQFEQWHCWSDRRMLNREDWRAFFFKNSQNIGRSLLQIVFS